MSKIIDAIENEQMQKDIPEFAPGDTVIVQVKVKEGNRERLQDRRNAWDNGAWVREAAMAHAEKKQARKLAAAAE